MQVEDLEARARGRCAIVCHGLVAVLRRNAASKRGESSQHTAQLSRVLLHRDGQPAEKRDADGLHGRDSENAKLAETPLHPLRVFTLLVADGHAKRKPPTFGRLRATIQGRCVGDDDVL